MSAYTRKKEPERLRQTLLECAARLVVEEGIAGVTVQSVATSAGVTKGGLFHHFPSKVALLEALFVDLIARLDADISERLAVEPEEHGCFTRAYVGAIFNDGGGGFGEPWVALSVAMIAEPKLRPLWANWLQGRLLRHAATDSAALLEVVRLAADGAWLSRVSSYDDALAHELEELRTELIVLTRGKTTPLKPSSSKG